MAELVSSGSKKISELTLVSEISGSTAIPIVMGGNTVQISHSDFLTSSVFNQPNVFTQAQTVSRNGAKTELAGNSIDMYVETGNGDTFKVEVITGEGLKMQDWNGANSQSFLEVDTNSGPITILRNTSIDGNLIVSGGITAELINVNLVSSSIVYSSGSNIFGNTVSNTHQFTGSLRVTGSTNIIGGFTQTGGVASFGGAATFNNSVSTFNQGVNIFQTASFFGPVNIGTSSQTRNLLHFGNYNHTGNTIQTGSISVNGNVIASSFTGSLDYTNLNNIPNGIVSSSTQINQYNIFTTTGSNEFVGNQNISGDVIVTGSLIVSGSNTFRNIGRAEFTGSVSVAGSVTVTQSITASFFTGSFVGDGSSLSGVTAADIDFVNVLNKPTLVSGSSQIDLTGTTNYESGIKDRLNVETVISSSQQILDYGVFVTTGSNTFVGNQIVTGSLRISGSVIQIGETDGNIIIESGSISLGSSRAFGGNSIAVGKALIVESAPFSIAVGFGLRTEYDSTALFGAYNTASNAGQTIIGIASKLDNSIGQGAFVIGNGTDVDNRSNLLVAQGNVVQISGSLSVSGSGNLVGSQTINGDTIITGSLIVSSSSTFTNIGFAKFTGSIDITGSSNLTGSVVINQLTYPTPNFADGQYGVEVPTLGVNNVFELEIPRTIYEYVKNDSGTTLLKGTPVHSVGASGFNTLVIAASASNAATMPATYILAQDLDDEEEGLGIAIGAIQGVNTTGLTAGDPVWVGANGGWTQTKPTGSNLIQNLGIVTKVGTNGGGVVLGAGRSNDVPNIQQGYFWVGNSGSVATPTPTASLLIGYATTGSNVFVGNQIISGSLIVTEGITGSFSGDGSGLTGLPAATSINTASFATTGSNVFVGNQTITGSINVSSSINVNGSINLPGSGSFRDFVNDPTKFRSIRGNGAGLFNIVEQGDTNLTFTVSKITTNDLTTAITSNLSGANNGSYSDVQPTTSGVGSGARLQLTISGGVVTSVRILNVANSNLTVEEDGQPANRQGIGYKVGDTLTVAAGSGGIGGSGNLVITLRPEDIQTYIGHDNNLTYDYNNTRTLRVASRIKAIGNLTIGEDENVPELNIVNNGNSSIAAGVGVNVGSDAGGSITVGYFNNNNQSAAAVFGAWHTASESGQTIIGLASNTTGIGAGAFILGNGTDADNKSNLLVAQGTTVQITGSLNVTGSLEVNNDVKIQNGYVILTNVSQSLEFVDDAAAEIGNVPLGGLYRSGSFIKIRIS